MIKRLSIDVCLGKKSLKAGQIWKFLKKKLAIVREVGELIIFKLTYKIKPQYIFTFFLFVRTQFHHSSVQYARHN